MPATITDRHELEELAEHQRGAVQLRQSEELTMGGHIRKKLRLGRLRLRETWGLEGKTEGDGSGEVDDDMQILARDITFNEPQPAQSAAPTTPTPTPQPQPAKSRWPLAAALALGLGIPGTTGIVMAPTIIKALKNDPPVVNVPTTPARPEYAPILLPGKPQGVK